MSRTRFRGLTSLLALLAAMACGKPAVPTSPRTYEIPYRGSVVLEVPDGWKEEVRQPSAGLPPTIRFSLPEGDAFSVNVNISWDMGQGPEFNAPDRLRLVAERASQRALRSAAETSLPLQELEGTNTRGFYFKATGTAKPSAPGEFDHLVHGLAALDDLLLQITVLSKDEAPELTAQALALIETAARKPAAAGAGQLAGGMSLAGQRLTNPEGGYALDVPEGWRVVETSNPLMVMLRSPNGDASLSILARPAKPALAADLAELKNGLIASPGRYTVVEEGMTTVAGRPAARLLTATSAANPPLVTLNYVIVEGPTAYFIGIETLADRRVIIEPVATTVLQSLTFETPG